MSEDDALAKMLGLPKYFKQKDYDFDKTRTNSLVSLRCRVIELTLEQQSFKMRQIEDALKATQRYQKEDINYGVRCHCNTRTYVLSAITFKQLLAPMADFNPHYYTRGSIEVWDFVRDQDLNYHLGNAIKYICRAGHKPSASKADDLKKAIHYLRK